MINTLKSMILAGAALLAALAPSALMAQETSYRTAHVRGLEIFYREAGPATAPTVLLLHGFPSSSHMFRDLIPALATKYHVVAPDYPGFGYSSAPALTEFSYTFANLADVMDDFTQAIGIDSYVIYMQDYGGPVGFRLAIKHPARVRGFIVQNAVVSADGWNAKTTAPLAALWRTRNAETEQAARSLLAASTTKFQYTEGASRHERVSPDAWILDQALLDRPGNDAIQLELLHQYRDNVARYPEWQEFLRAKQAPTLIVWGRNDPIFTLAGLEQFKRLLPGAEVHTFDAGHFALETHGPEISRLALDFLDRLKPVN